MRARGRLRERLARRGLAPVVGIPLEGAAVPAPLVEATARAGLAFVRGSTVPLISASALTLAHGVTRTMLATRWIKISGALALLGLAPAATLLIAAQPPAAEAPAPAPPLPDPAPQGADTPAVVLPAEAAMAQPLPGREELHRLLRRAAEELTSMSRDRPQKDSWALTSIASAQARAGDLDAARATFRDAAREAAGEFGGDASAWNLWRVAHFQAASGLGDDARESLQLAFDSAPGLVGVTGRDNSTLETLAVIAREQAGLGARDAARRTVEKLVTYAEEFSRANDDPSMRDLVGTAVAASLAAVGDFDAAFAMPDSSRDPGLYLGAIALAAAEVLGRGDARRFVEEAAVRLEGNESADRRYHALSDLAEARARIGDVEGARRSALRIGADSTRVDYDLTDGQPYALVRVAAVQREAGDLEGARETLRLGFRTIADHPRMRAPEGRLRQIASAQIGIGDLEGARRCAEAMRPGRARPEILALLARRQAIAGDADSARATFVRALEEALSRGTSPSAPYPIGPNPSEVASIRAMAGDVDGALEMLRSIREQRVYRSALGRIVSARTIAGDLATALRLAMDEPRSLDDRRITLREFGDGVETRLRLEPPGKFRAGR